MSIIDPERIRQIFNECLWYEGDGLRDRVEVEGVVHNALLHRGRMMGYRDDVVRFLGELPEQFDIEHGRGWSFLMMCDDRHGEQWTGLHLRMEQLFQLGYGLGCASFILQREHWHVLPGEMPYIVVHLQGANAL